MSPPRGISATRQHLLAFAPVALILSALAWSSDLARRAQDGRAWVRHGEAVLTSASAARSHLKEAETGQRGYLLTGEPNYLAPYRSGHDSVGVELHRLETLTSDNARQQRTLATLGPVIRRRLDIMDTTIALRGRGDAEGSTDLVRS